MIRRVARQVDLAAAPRPDAGDGAHQRALAGPGFAHDQHAFGGADVGRRAGDQHVAGGAGDVEVAERDRVGIVLADHDRLGLRVGLLLVERVERVGEAVDAVDACVPLRDPRVVVDQPAQRRLHVDHRRDRLHEAAESDLAGEVHGRSDQHRQDHAEQHVGRGQRREAAGREPQAAPRRRRAVRTRRAVACARRHRRASA